jgi:hypothetical protein
MEGIGTTGTRRMQARVLAAPKVHAERGTSGPNHPDRRARGSRKARAKEAKGKAKELRKIGLAKNRPFLQAIPMECRELCHQNPRGEGHSQQRPLHRCLHLQLHRH